MTETILVVNAGSSSIKFQVFEVSARDQLELCIRLRGKLEAKPRQALHRASK